MSNEKSYGKSLLILLVPVILGVIIFFQFARIRKGVDAGNVGKPHFYKADHYGKVEQVFVKPGDLVAPGAELLGYTITDAKGSAGKTAEEAEAVEVTLRTITGQTFEDSMELPGIVTAFAEVEVTARVGGELVELNYVEGMKVEKGDVIARIDPRDYQIALDKARSGYDLARLQYERLGNLQKKNAISASSFDDAMSGYKIAKASLDEAALALERCVIKAPCSGIVDARFPEVGEVLKSGDAVVRVIDISRVKVQVGIPEQDVDMVRRTREIDFRMPCLDNALFKGIVHHVSSSSSKLATVFPMEVHTSNPDGRLLPGMVAKVRVIRRVYDEAILLPIFLVIAGDDEYFTYVNNNGHAEKKVLNLGTMQERWVHVKSGLRVGDMVIDKGLRTVNSGTTLKIIGAEETGEVR